MGLAKQEKTDKFREALKFCMSATSRLSPALPQFPLLLCIGSVLEKTRQTMQYLYNYHMASAVTKGFLL